MDQDGPRVSISGLCGSRVLMGHAVDYVQPISSEVPDWTREEPSQFWDPGRKLLHTIRRYQSWQQRPGLISRFSCKILVFRHAFWSVVTGADIPLNCQIGGGLLIPHPNGIVIHPAAKIGVNCLIFQQVTIGIRDARGFPEIAGHVDIGAGAKVLGAVKIGPHARIGANAVVTRDIEGGMVAVGNRPIPSAGTD
jgi:serine O-acetyltransferase